MPDGTDGMRGALRGGCENGGKGRPSGGFEEAGPFDLDEDRPLPDPGPVTVPHDLLRDERDGLGRDLEEVLQGHRKGVDGAQGRAHRAGATKRR